MRLAVHVRANARTPQVGGSFGGSLIVKVAAPAVDGEANKAVIDALADAFLVAKGTVRILQGRRSPRKLIEITGDEVFLANRFSILSA